jgi:hypothetical protein
MSKGIDRMIAYRTMRAVEGEQKPPRTRWQRWQAWVNRWADRLTGVR